jgi:RNA polymerase sigma-70 factor (ECF subfamily)
MKKVDFKILLEDNQQLIAKICRAYSNSPEEFEDYFQEVSLQIWKSYDSFKGASQLSTWIYRITLNVCLTELRKSKKRINTYAIQAEHDLSDTATEYKNDEVEQLYAAIRTLKKIDRAIILLFLEDRKYKEMAEILGISITNIGVKISRIKKELKQKLNGK